MGLLLVQPQRPLFSCVAGASQIVNPTVVTDSLGKEQRAKGKEQRAKGIGQRTKSKE